MRLSTAAACEWSAAADASWVRVLTPNGRGEAGIDIEVDRNDGSERTARVRVMDQMLALTQDAAPLVWIPHTLWTLLTVNSEEQSFPARYAFDGDPATFWHTEYSKTQRPHPHEIGIDLGAVYQVASVRYLPRQDGSPIGRIGRFELYVSMDGATWGAPAAAGTLADTASAQEIGMPRRLGRYILLRSLSEASGRDYTAIAELDVLGSR